MARCRYRQLTQANGLFVYVFLVSCMLINLSDAETLEGGEMEEYKSKDVNLLLDTLLEKPNPGLVDNEIPIGELTEEEKRQFLSSSGYGKRQFLGNSYPGKRQFLSSAFGKRDSSGQFFSGKRDPQFFNGKRDPQFFNGKRDAQPVYSRYEGKRTPQFFNGK